MTNGFDSSRLISHGGDNNNLDAALQELRTTIKQQGDTEHFSCADRLDFLQQLSEFDFGRFLILNRGINGYWTHYMLTYPWFKPKTRGLEHELLHSPLMLATQQRFEIFLKQNQTMVKDGACLASVPCGMLGELLYLDYSNVSDIQLFGLDYDPDTLKDAQTLAEQKNLQNFVTCQQTDAWQMNQNNRFDLISSNGLNIYEADDNKVTDLYRQFHQALKSGGKLVTSFVTPPPQLTSHCEWKLDQLDLRQLAKQKAIFADTLHAKWQCFRSSETTHHQLQQAGFSNIEFFYDNAHLFPTVTAWK